ncbi:LicD family-domain-containing protein [Xylaria telfairii]|nr:LicD family-domain-containing protein [Xylaria telfairii]
MHALHPILLLALAIHAAPVIVVETAVVTKIATPTVVVHVQAAGHDAKPKQQEKVAAPKKSTTKPTKPKEQKYFHEPGWDAESGHYDARYFNGKVPYEQHRTALRHLVRSYLTTFRALGIETWLAHGSLLGWWWNGRIMPWDYDLDVQVSTATLSFLGERYNRSMHEYEYEVDNNQNGPVILLDDNNNKNNSASESENLGRDDSRGVAVVGSKMKKTYLLDINPHHGALTKGNGANIIDARWIDTSNGMFIDITGLRERDPAGAPGVWSCKNNHRYLTGELWPLRRTEFEGAEAWIPYSFDKVLTDEYGAKSLVTEEWAGHRWMPQLREWVKMAKKKKPAQEEKKEEEKKKEEEEEKKEEEKEERPLTDDKGTKQVVVYEEVVVEV